MEKCKYHDVHLGNHMSKIGISTCIITANMKQTIEIST